MKGNTPCRKASFSSEYFADEYILKLEKTSTRKRKPVRSYLCTKCLNWHLTSIKDAELSELRETVFRLNKEITQHVKTIKKLTAIDNKNKKLERRAASFKLQLERVQMKFSEYKEQVQKSIDNM